MSRDYEQVTALLLSGSSRQKDESLQSNFYFNSYLFVSELNPNINVRKKRVLSCTLTCTISETELVLSLVFYLKNTLFCLVISKIFLPSLSRIVYESVIPF